MSEVASLRKTLADNEKIIIKAVVAEVEQTKLQPHSEKPEVPPPPPPLRKIPPQSPNLASRLALGALNYREETQI